MPNRLIGETSPYLLQHADNPVDWYPWGEEALTRARAEDRPILLSIGYAACHWCHVMERESFEDPAIAHQMNASFVCIKVDREERPDLDSIYMDAVQAMTGHGGWPMTLFLTAEGIPFFGGTYFPPEDRHGLPGFPSVLRGVSEAWRERRSDVTQQGNRVADIVSKQSRPRPSAEMLDAGLVLTSAHRLAATVDATHGGLGPAPKFPQPPVYEFLMRIGAKQGGNAAEATVQTLRAMAAGGIYDQIGGGFHRYSTDARWLVPHFEKMLYDNAQLARLYTHAWQAWGGDVYRRIALDTLGYLLRDMRDGEGGFYSSEDADSEGEEGRFYVWELKELEEVASGTAEMFGATEQGNFEGRNILTWPHSQAPPAEIVEALLAARSVRERPGRDEKILVSWNALAISALAEAGETFGRPDLVDAARTAAAFLLDNLTKDGRLMHSFKDGRTGALGMLEDYAYLAEALLALWEASFEPRWIEESERLIAEMLRLFWDEEDGGFFTTASDHERLIVRQKEIVESATPSPNGVASLVLQKLAVLTGHRDHAAQAVQILRLARPYMDRAPQAVPTHLCAVDFYLSGASELVVVGARDDPRTQALLEVIWTRFLPNRVLAGSPPGVASPLLEGKSPSEPTAYVCRDYACQRPATSPELLASQLA